MAISASLRALLQGETVAGSRLSSRLADDLVYEGLLLVITRGSRKSYRARDVSALRRYLTDRDEQFRLLETSGSESRAEQAAPTGNSKLVAVRACPGFAVNSYEPISCRLSGQPFVVAPQAGTFWFVADWQQFELPADVTIVGIENMENFRRIRQQRALFDSYLSAHGLPLRALFVSRYPQSSDLRRWLMQVPNPYLHFGDFDLAGIHIFLSEFAQYLGTVRASFLIPTDIEHRLASGSAFRYDTQLSRYTDLTAPTPALQQLIDLIHRVRKGYDQEGYIDSPRIE
jgi:hypothetical protein